MKAFVSELESSTPLFGVILGVLTFFDDGVGTLTLVLSGGRIDEYVTLDGDGEQ